MIFFDNLFIHDIWHMVWYMAYGRWNMVDGIWYMNAKW